MSPDASDDEYAEEQMMADAEEAYLADIPQNLHEDAIRSYLGSYGDAIDERVRNLSSVASFLRANNFFGPSIAVSSTTFEVMMRYFCLRPIIAGAFMSDFISRTVTEKIMDNRRFPERDVLVAILQPWGINLNLIMLSSGKSLWSEYLNTLIPERNGFVHQGDDISAQIADVALECVKEFRAQVVMAMAKRLGFTHDKTGCWSRVLTDPKEHLLFGGKITNQETIHTTRSPFE